MYCSYASENFCSKKKLLLLNDYVTILTIKEPLAVVVSKSLYKVLLIDDFYLLSLEGNKD